MIEVSKAAFVIAWSLKQVRKAYRLGAEVKLDAALIGRLDAYAGQREWDCSELVQTGLFVGGVERVGRTTIQTFDGAGNQFLATRRISLATASRLPGALLFVKSERSYASKPAHVGHVGMVIAPGYAVEARGAKWGVVITRIAERSWNEAGKVPELYLP